MMIEVEGAINRNTAALLALATEIRLHCADGNTYREESEKAVYDSYERHKERLLTPDND